MAKESNGTIWKVLLGLMVTINVAMMAIVWDNINGRLENIETKLDNQTKVWEAISNHEARIARNEQEIDRNRIGIDELIKHKP